jgi:cleavage stimulation factor subunit 3
LISPPQASQLYERAISGVLSTCPLLYFAYADFEEQNMKYEKVHTIYQKFLDLQETGLCQVTVHAVLKITFVFLMGL